MNPDFDLSKCKDVEFARNLIAQMKGQSVGGRNSVRDVEPQSPLYAVPKEGENWMAQAIQQRPLGRTPDMMMQMSKAFWYECGIGDMVKASKMPDVYGPHLVIQADSECEWKFQRVVLSVPVADGFFEHQFFWQRIK